ncbi:dicarboxylate/amino acid:cation symporter [Bacillus sp. S2(2019)]|uniref:dicarboxylate/amino acid:cation symporter n=1 Tax=Bacillus TaxID=1386 RepID=UPI0010AE397F|nr:MULTISPECIES: dicarboxylate/amino acid:cation symporter [Bacillus]MBU8692840.1 dicarboxylate/amino acid:cation symporter [Bacillus altitudinis]MBX7001499.1 dicarboxylate/amino acid:cation symporter [Bacillus aerophilus]MBX7013098.1 dicarboxylate/amino acid:cation symporter [Bacillus aerophilus]TKD58305.1 dicarboxylate/amino acid:cation symporter [Bacillus sp. S2(2019)]
MKKLGLGTKVFIGFVIGILLGLIFKEKILIIKPIGDIFLTLIKMIVVPLIFFSITSGIFSIGDVQKLKKIGTKTLIYYIGTTLIAGGIGLLVAHIFKPGNGIDIDSIKTSSEYKAANIPTFGETILGLFPSNPVQALAEGNLMQIIIFSIFLGISIVLIGNKSVTLRHFFEEGTQVMYKMTGIIMAFSPIGVAALMACTIGEYGLKIFGPLGKFILVDYIGLISVIILMYLFMLKFIAKIPLSKFFKSIGKIWVVTASTTSSSGTLPVTISVTKEDFKVKEELAQFTLPIGATMNMNGAVVYYSAAIIFVSQIYGIDMPISQQLLVILMTTLISVGSPGIPGGGIVMTIMLLTTLGLPMEIVGMIAGIYRIIDMGHTSLNVTGDVVSTLCIARSENMIEDEQLNVNKINDIKY